MVQVFTTFVLWNEFGVDGNPLQLKSGTFNLSGNKKEYRFVFNIGSSQIDDNAGVYVLARQFQGSDVYDRFPDNNRDNFKFSAGQC